jgi:hypothetical protein
MPNRISHDMAKEQEIVFDYFPAVAYLAVVDLGSYRFFAAPGLDYFGMLAHVGVEAAHRRCVAWGCPETQLRIRLTLTQDHKALKAVTDYAAGFQGWVRTQGRLCFTGHDDLYYCATYPDASMFGGPESPDSFLPHELLVPPGMYSVIVFRHFPWFDGSQDAPLLGEGPHYSVILRHYADESDLGRLPPPSLVPWT